MTDNLANWVAVEKTDPKYTKQVKQRGGFTSVNAQYQIKRATELFGTVGVGWGYENSPIQIENGFAIIGVTVWTGSRENSFGPVYGCAQMFGERLDSDAPKKASTDGLTKALSHIGIAADIFLGMYDDNKYLAEISGEFAGKSLAEKPVPQQTLAAIGGAETMASLQTVWNANKEWHRHPEFIAAKDQRKKELGEPQ